MRASGRPQSIRDTLTLGVTRIGHGVHAADDPALMRELVDRGTVLEVCPGSNVALGVYPDWASHPIAKLADAGVKVTVSTDDPPSSTPRWRMNTTASPTPSAGPNPEFAELNHLPPTRPSAMKAPAPACVPPSRNDWTDRPQPLYPAQTPIIGVTP